MRLCNRLKKSIRTSHRGKDGSLEKLAGDVFDDMMRH